MDNPVQTTPSHPLQKLRILCRDFAIILCWLAVTLVCSLLAWALFLKMGNPNSLGAYLPPRLMRMFDHWARQTAEAVFLSIYLIPLLNVWWRRQKLVNVEAVLHGKDWGRQSWHYALIILVSLALPLYGHYFGVFEKEELYDSILSTWIHSKAILDGRLPLWTSVFGFGSPHPMTPNLIYHPLGLLFSLLPLGACVTIFRVLHLVVGLSAVYLLSHKIRISRLAAVCVMVTYLFSAPSTEYYVSQLWLSAMSTWTLLPATMLALIYFFDAQETIKRVFAALILSFVVAFQVLNSNPGWVAAHIVVYVCCCTMFWIKSSDKWQRLFILACSGVLVAMAFAEQGVHIIDEMQHIEQDVERFQVNYGYPQGLGSFFWALLFRPLELPWFHTLTGLSDGAFMEWGRKAFYEYIISNIKSVRPFLGFPFAMLALYACFSRSIASPYKRIFAANFLVSLILCLIPSTFFRVLSGSSAYTDPLIFFAALLGGVALTSIEQMDTQHTSVAKKIAYAQILVLAFGVYPIFHSIYSATSYRTPNGYYCPTEQRYISDMLLTGDVAHKLRMMGVKGSDRIYAFDLRFRLQGLVYAGFTSVNARIKGISFDAMYPAKRYIYGEIPGESEVLLDPALLSVMGINWVFSSSNATYVSPLVSVGKVFIKEDIDWQRKDMDLKLLPMHILNNPEAWPRAVFVSEAARNFRLPRKPGSAHDRLMAADFAPALAMREGGILDIVHQEDGMVVMSMPPSKHERTIMFGEMYRPGWQARTNYGTVETFPVLEAFVGVTVPAGADSVVLEYRPSGLIVARWVTYSTLALYPVLIGLAAVYVRKRRT